MKKTIVYAVILSVVSIVMGIVAGVAIERGNTIKHLSLLGRPPLPPEKLLEQRKTQKPQDIFRRIAEELSLNEEQKKTIKQILDEAHERLKQTGERSREDIKAIREETNIKILKILSPEQQDKFKKILTQDQEQHSKLMRKLQRLGQRQGFPEGHGPAGAPDELAPAPGEELPEPPETF